MRNLSIGLALLFALNSCQNQPEVKTDSAEYHVAPVALSAINPPLNQEIPFTTLEVRVDRDTSFTLESGTYLKIPPRCFVDSVGRPIEEGSVQLKFREFRNATDIFLSGIPMTYQGKSFESAGMCELKGENGIGFASGKNVEIGLESKRSDSDYKLYSLNEGSGEWSDIGKDSVVRSETESTELFQSQPTTLPQKQGAMELSVVEDDLVEMEPVKPLSQKDAEGFWVIQIKIDNPQAFPELSEYEGVRFKVVDGKQRAGDAKVNWYTADLEQAERQGAYRIHFQGYNDAGGVEERRYLVEPVYEGEDYEKAMEAYQKKFITYQRKKEEQKKLAEERRRQYVKDSIKEAKQWKIDSAKWVQQWKKDSTERAERQAAWEAEHAAEAGVNRVFSVSNFGIYNCDRFYSPVGQTRDILALFEDAEGNALPGKMYLMDKGRNAVLVHYINEGRSEPLSIYSGMDVRVALITTDQRLAIARNAEDILTARGEQVTLVMDVYDVADLDVESMEKLLL